MTQDKPARVTEAGFCVCCSSLHFRWGSLLMNVRIIRLIVSTVLVFVLSTTTVFATDVPDWRKLPHHKRLYDQLILHEGIRLKPYRCPAGKLTIGVGRNLDDNGISTQEAYVLLDNDLKRSVVDARGIVPGFEKLNDVRQAVMIDMVFNLGATRFSRFRGLLLAVGASKFEQAADAMTQTRWCRQVGRRCPRLVAMMRSGKWYWKKPR